MADSTPDTETDAGDAEQTRGMPRWVKVSLLVVVGLVLLVVILNLAGVAPGGHGPSRHMPGGGAPATSVPEGGGHNPGMHDR